MSYVFCSGVDNLAKIKACDALGMPRVLVSFPYVRKNKRALKWMKDYDFQWMIDSGAFTLNKKRHSRAFVRAYLDEYLEFLRDNKDDIWGAVGMDVDYAVSKDYAIELEKEFEPLEAEGMRICHVWHHDRGPKDWERMCVQHRWVGIPGGFYDEHMDTVPSMVAIARKHLTVVHGFAVTRAACNSIPFFSVDSSTWVTGAQYGRTQVFENGRVKWIEKAERPRYVAQWAQSGIDTGLIHKDGYQTVYQINLIAYRNWEEFLLRRHHPESLELKPMKPGWWEKKSRDQIIKEHRRLWGAAVEEEFFENDTDTLRWTGQAISYISYMSYDSMKPREEWFAYIEAAFGLAGKEMPPGTLKESDLDALRDTLFELWAPAREPVALREQHDIQPWQYKKRTPSEMPSVRPIVSISLPKRPS